MRSQPPLAKASASNRSDVLIAASHTREDRHSRNPPCEIILSTAFDPKYGTGACRLIRRCSAEAMVGCQRQNQASAFGEAIEPAFCWLRTTGIDVDDIRLVECDRRTVTLEDRDGWMRRKIDCGPGGQFGVVLNANDSPRAPGEMRENSGVVGSACA